MRSRNALDKKVFLFAGEQSGDNLGADLIPHLKEKGLSPYGVGGSAMVKMGLELFLPMEAFQVMGITAVMGALPKLWTNFRKIKKEILKTRPSAVILIDYADFNMLLSSRLRKEGYKGKIIHYVSPSVWAWRKKRIYSLAKNLDLLLTILPFEKKYYAKTDLKVEYVGHPLVKKVQNYPYDPLWRQKCGISKERKILALFPGSRGHEIEHNLPVQLAVASKKPEFLIAISCARDSLKGKIEKHLKGIEGVIVPSNYCYELMRDCEASLATSGTVTLELCLHKRPTVVTYRLPLLNYLLGRYIFRIRLPYFALPNVIAGFEVFPEFFHRKLSTTEIKKCLDQILTHPEKIESAMREVETCLEICSASERAAAAILKLL